MQAIPTRALGAVAAFGAGKALPGAVTFISIPIWLSTYGPGSYALYSLYWATSLIATSFATGWLRQAILRFAGRVGPEYEALHPTSRRAIEASPVLALLPLAGLAIPLSASAQDLVAFLGAAVVGLATQSAYGVQLTLLQRDGRAGAYAVAEVVRSSATLALSLAAVAAFDPSAWALVASGALATGFAVLVLRRSSRRRLVEPPAQPSGILAEYWSYGWQMSLWLTGSASLIYIDRFVVSLMYGAERAGAYAAAADIAVRGMSLIVAPVIMFAHPTFMRLWNTALQTEAIMWWRRATVAVGVAALLATGAAVVAYGYIGDLLEGDQVSVRIFAVLAVGAAAWQVALMVHKPLEALGRTRFMLVSLGCSGMSVIGMNVALAPRFAEQGVALASATGALVYICMVAAASRRSIRLTDERTPVGVA